MAAQDAQNEQLRKAVEQALAASFVARRAKADVAKDLLNKDRPPTADDIRQALEDGGWAKELRIKVHELHKQATTEKIHGKDSLASVQKARKQWEASINDELRAIASERRVPLVRKRKKIVIKKKEEETDELIEMKVEEVLSPTLVTPGTRFLFDSDDLLDAISHIESPSNNEGWGLVKLQLRTATLTELRDKYKELHPSKRQYGVDDVAGDPRDRNKFADAWHELGEKCLAEGHVPLARTYARRGVPPSLRPAIYRSLLGLPHMEDAQTTSAFEERYYEDLRDRVDAIELVTDELYQMDVQHVADDDTYFIFDEMLGNCVLAFSRDAWVVKNSVVKTHSTLPCESELMKGQPVPPCGVQPFRGFVSYAAPLTFVFGREPSLYFAFRAFYAQHFCRLNVLRTNQNTLLPLCALFERLVIEHHPRLFFYLVQVGVDPLAIALPWIQFGFVGLLDVEQVLLLWDRLLGFEDLSLLSVLAAAIFVYRSEKLLQCSSLEEAREMFQDGAVLEVVPLLQTFLWPEGL